MTKKTTKRSLFTSVVALILCLSMLIGTTYAWFTDTVESGNNIIKAGNLDIELYYQNDEVTTWTKVTKTTNVFKEALWEPGHTEMVRLKIVNEGSLELKYQLGASVVGETGSTNVNGDAFKLSDYIKYGFVDGMDDYTRTEAINAVEEEGATTLAERYNSGTKTLPIADENNAGVNEHIVTMVVYLPYTVGNEVNYDRAGGYPAPTINLGLNLLATQAEAESDSFGPDLDADANLPVVESAKKEDGESVNLGADNSTGNAGAGTEGIGVKVPEGAPAGDYTMKVDNYVQETDADGVTTVSFDLSLFKDGVKVQDDGTTVYSVSINVGTGLNIAKLVHDGNEITDYDYDRFGTGVISFTVSDFSPFSIEYNVPESFGVAKDDLVAGVACGGGFKLTEDVTLDETLIIPEGKTVTIDLNGHTLTIPNETTTYAINNHGTLTLKDTSAEGTGKVIARGIYNGYGNGGANYPDAKITVESGNYHAAGTNGGGAAIFNYGKVEINGGTFTSVSTYSIANNGGSMVVNGGYIVNGINSIADLTINGGKIEQGFSGYHVVHNWESKLIVNGGDFYNNNSGNATIMASKNSTVTINAGTFGIKDGRVPGDGNTWTSCLLDAKEGGKLILNGGTFNGGFRVQAAGSALVTGGSFNDIYASAYHIYNSVTIIGGSFTDAAAISFAKKYVAIGHSVVENADGTCTVVPVSIDANSVVLPDGVTEESFGANVAYVDGTYYASLEAACVAIHNSGASNSVLYIKPGADLGSVGHAHVCSNITVYGNNAFIRGGERDFEIGMPQTVSCTIDSEITLNVYNLDGCAAWGSLPASHKYDVNVNFVGCENVTKIAIHKGEEPTVSKLRISATDCTFLGTATYRDSAVYCKNLTELVMTNCTFTNYAVGINQNNRGGKETYILTNCKFVDCSIASYVTTQTAYAAPVRAVASVAGTETTLILNGCQFTYTTDETAINGDVLTYQSGNAGTVNKVVIGDAE